MQAEAPRTSSRRILLAVTGLSPQIVTETLYALAIATDTPFIPTEIHLATTAEGKVDVFEYLQNPEQLAKYELLSNCIACGVCEGACPVYAGGDAFIGPAALIWASRFVNDSRDTKAMERMDAIDTADGVAACQSVRACSRHCPRGIDVGEEMWQIVAKVRER